MSVGTKRRGRMKLSFICFDRIHLSFCELCDRVVGGKCESFSPFFHRKNGRRRSRISKKKKTVLMDPSWKLNEWRKKCWKSTMMAIYTQVSSFIVDSQSLKDDKRRVYENKFLLKSVKASFDMPTMSSHRARKRAWEFFKFSYVICYVEVMLLLFFLSAAA